MFLAVGNYLYNISIPYGAIKRKYGVGVVCGAVSFQFLMVRLKVYFYVCVRMHAHISIPYGAIKRLY